MRVLIILLLIFSSLRIHAGSTAQPIKDYKIYTAVCVDIKSGKSFFSLRRYISGGKTYLLLVNPYSLETAASASDRFKIRPESIEKIRNEYKNTNYFKAIARAEKNSRPLHNAGITRFSPDFHGVFITADLCPSNKALDRNFFTELIKIFDKTLNPVPVALSLSGRWLKSHKHDFEWLTGLEKKKKISVTWINHSYNHYGNESLPLSKNFLLKEKTGISYEILETEKAMINSGVAPSVFFRFPGLVSNEKIFNMITGYGLIPLGSDSWLSKEQFPKSGSIILVHANGNDPVGIQRFFKLIEINRESIAKKYWNIYDIREGAEKLK